MFVGPVFSRELVRLPRRPRLYFARTVYVASLLGLMITAWLILIGTQEVRNLGDWARFGGRLFALLAPLQLVVVTFLAAMVSAAAVAQEKDRRTLVLLLLTNLNNCELVLGRLLSSLLTIFTMIVAAIPLFAFMELLGGISYGQIARTTAITLASAFVAGSLGSTIALWREKTFQTLALTSLAIVLWLLAWEFVAQGALGREWQGISALGWASMFSPWQAMLAAARPLADVSFAGWFQRPEGIFLLVSCVGAVLVNGIAIGLVRVWNPSRQIRSGTQQEEDSESEAESDSTQPSPPTTEAGRTISSPGRRAIRHRRVWDNPILWREIRTWTYGKKIIFVRLVYLLIFAASAYGVYATLHSGEFSARGTLIPQVAWPLLPLLVLSVILVNALSVTSITAERDGQAFDLLLVTDITPKEFVFGKLLGVAYNAKEVIGLPLLLCIYLWWDGGIRGIFMIYLIAGLLVLYLFSAVLGLHVGLTYPNSRTAIGTSLGTLFFLFLGVATCMRMMVAFQGSWIYQFFAFVTILFGGGIALFVALGFRNPSPAITWASFAAPFATFFVITSFLLSLYGQSFLVTTLTYGWATAAMLMPALYEFDVATGRSTDLH